MAARDDGVGPPRRRSRRLPGARRPQPEASTPLALRHTSTGGIKSPMRAGRKGCPPLTNLEYDLAAVAVALHVLVRACHVF
jgi:hypothetical protein